MQRLLTWLLLLVLFGGFLTAAVRALRARAQAGRGLPAYSVYSEERNGLAETARFVRRLGWEPVAVTRPLPLRHGREPSLLVLVEPETGSMVPGLGADLPEVEVRALLRWVHEGNTLLVCCGRQTWLHQELGASVIGGDAAEAAEVTAVELAEGGSYLADIDRLLVEDRGSVDAGKGLPLWWVRGRPGAVVLRHGRGRVLLVADPSLVTARGLRRADNALFLYHVLALHARDGRVYFDEYHHGIRSGGGFWDYLRQHGQQGAVLAVLAVVAVAVWAAALRLGPPVPAPRPPRADAVDYASALARIYQKAGVRRLLGRSLARGFLASLTQLLHLRRAALPAEVLAAWRDRHPGEPLQRLQGLLRGTAELRRGEVSEGQLLAWARRFDQFLHEQETRRRR